MAGLDPAAVVYRLEPSGLSFSEPVPFEVTMDLEAGPDGSVVPPLVVTVGDDGVWEPLALDVTLDPEAGAAVVEGEISHFSWIVGHGGALAIGLEEISPKERGLGDPWEAAVEVRNVSTGTQSGFEYSLIVQFVGFEALGEVEAVGTDRHAGFTLARGEGRALDFPKPRWQCKNPGEGAYRVVARAEIGGGLSSTFVKEIRLTAAGLQKLVGEEVRTGDYVFTAMASVPVVCVTGYEPSGGGDGMTVTGKVPDITQPFTLSGNFGGGAATLKFSPGVTVTEPETGDIASSGTFTYSGGGSGVTVSGAGSYEISGTAGEPLKMNFEADGCATPASAGRRPV